MVADFELRGGNVSAVVLSGSEASGVAKTGAEAASMSNPRCNLCVVVGPAGCSGTNGGGGGAVGKEGATIGKEGRLPRASCSSTRPEWKPLPPPSRFTRLLDIKLLRPKVQHARPEQAIAKVAAIQTSPAWRLGHILLVGGASASSMLLSLISGAVSNSAPSRSCIAIMV